jgi:hypothetical protein
MKILAKNHPFSIFERDRRMENSTFKDARALRDFFEESFYIINPPLEKKVFIVFLQEQRDFPFFNERK